VRAYDDGVAYRWKTTLPGEVIVVGEDVSLTFAGDHLVYFPEEESLLSHQERSYKKLKISEIAAGRFSSLSDGPASAAGKSSSPRPTSSTTPAWTCLRARTR
jgi:hypothetical protein